ncbi:DUF167-domain-containing protein [Aspergillus uvarum CBS 121591]|uniref:DUF167-domain-containing protein n=1 Tax=Aspergillus uvarum CBS 121591 TaxID=1448315 RepID=A0A319CM10_9EURO|nr:DUF167-domain-containing protein [Aspergillus uvarum CBS 121591]PYH86535.1 DUF167-domain-containing protein [Aspergillus uvarum CBS 121591]
MTTPPILRLIPAVTPKSRVASQLPRRYSLQITCNVKPNASNNREGIVDVSADRVSVCVAALPRNGEANAAVSRIVAQAFKVPKSDVEVIRGLKSRDKTLSIANLEIGSQSEDEYIQQALERLRKALI